MNNILQNIIYSAIIGDASGYTLGGMKKAHIKAVFKDSTGYPDPAPGLKDNMERWKKPGLYSSITQFMLMAAGSVEKRGFRVDRFLDTVKNAPELPGTDYSFFRDPGHAEKNLIVNVMGGAGGQSIPYIRSCARILPVSIPLLLSDNRNSLFDSIAGFVSLFTTDSITAFYCILFLHMLKDLSSMEGESIIESSIFSVDKFQQLINGNQHEIFNSGHNPDYFIEHAREFSELIKKLQGIAGIEKGEKIICESVNRRLKTPVTRGSVNLPETILPFALLISELSVPRSSVFHRSSREGGSASALASISSALSAAFYGADVPDELKEGLADKKKIMHILDAVNTGSRGDIITILYETEPGLTLKEQEEFRARNKKEPKKVRPEKRRKDVESELTKHVVESWTKADKAKWRKEREKRGI